MSARPAAVDLPRPAQVSPFLFLLSAPTILAGGNRLVPRLDPRGAVGERAALYFRDVLHRARERQH